MILVLFLSLLLMGQIALTAGRSMLRDAEVPKRILRESGLYTQIMSSLTEEMMTGVAGEEMEFTPEEAAHLLATLLPASQLQRMTEPVVDGLHSWFWSGEGRPTLVMDLTQLRAALPGALRPIIMAKIESLPVCSPQQAAGLAEWEGEGNLPCRSPDRATNERIVERMIALADMQQSLPARVDLAAELEEENGPAYWAEVAERLSPARRALNLIPYGWGLLLLLFALLAVLNLERWYTPFGWISAPLLAGGLIMLLVGALGAGLAAPTLLEVMEVQESAAGQSALQMTLGLFSTLIRNFGTGAVLIGLLALITAVVGNRRADSTTDPSTDVA